MSNQTTFKEFIQRGINAQKAIDKILPLSHTDDPITSYEAADRMVKSGALSRQEKEVYKAIELYIHAIRTAGSLHYTKSDFTAKDIFSSSTISYHTIQRRLSGLRNKGRIERISTNNNGKPPWEKRDGCCVCKIRGLNNANR